MSDGPPVPALSFRPEMGALLLLALLGIALGLSASTGPVIGIAVAALGVAVGALIHRSIGERARTAAVAPMIATFGLLALWAPITLTSEVLAGGIGIGLLLWIASEPYPRGRWVDASGALLLPMLAVLVGVMASLLLPSAQDFLGVAAGLLVAELLFAGWLYAHPAELAGAAEAVSS
ncbi:MAG TPA: hypothetical protein VGV89_08995 [Thermoplasmata archaeon]|nr:hypothetical protein [Thermoplasmata archaeon]